jgi:TRAP-type C4-dicarboxylate transport system permease small subunit
MQNPSRSARITAFAERIGQLIEQVSGALCVACFAAMTIVTLLGVFFRYVMQSPFMWTEEVARYLLVWMGFTAINIALRQNKHIKVEALAKVAPPVIKKLLGYVVDFMIAFFMVFLLKQGYLMTIDNMMTASTFHLSMSWILVAVPVAAALTLIQLILNVVKKILSEFGPKPESAA